MKHLLVWGLLGVLVGCAATVSDVRCSRHLVRINPVAGAPIVPVAANDARASSLAAKASVP